MYRFEWDSFVTQPLLSEVAGIAGVSSQEDLEHLRPLLAQVFTRVSGLRLTPSVDDVQSRTEFATELLHDAGKHVLRKVRKEPDSSGYVRWPSSFPELEEMVSAVERVPVNRATANQIEAGLGVSTSLANRIVEERTNAGPFTSLDDLDDRVSGFGPVTREAIAPAVRFDQPSELLARTPFISGGFDEDFGRLVDLQDGGDQMEKLTAALRLLAAETAAHPHPATQNHAIRERLPEWNVPTMEVAWLGLLFGSDYYHQQAEMLSSAQSSVDVCMFHIALPDPTHPTRHLLDALKTANEGGATVRVLLDRDRERDPYLSTVINTPAKEFLTSEGIACRFDRPDRLLHSKFVVIDTSLVVLGSHNWSAGSYFRFDDLSVVIPSTEFAQELSTRFESMWSEAGD